MIDPRHLQLQYLQNISKEKKKPYGLFIYFSAHLPKPKLWERIQCVLLLFFISQFPLMIIDSNPI